MSFEVEQLEAGGEDEYQQFLLGIDRSLVYYSLDYARFLVDLLHCEAEYCVARSDGDIVGILPLMSSDSANGRVVNSLPYYGSNGGVLATTEAARNGLYGHYRERVAWPGTVAAALVSHPSMGPKPEEVAHDLADERLAGFTELPSGGDAEALLALIDGSARRNVNKAERSGVTVHVDNDAWGFLEDVHRENMAAISGNAKAPEFFTLLARHFDADSQYRIYVAEAQGETIAALLVILFNRTAEYLVPATRLEARSLQPMAAILRRAMVDASAEGYRYWNWGGTWMSQETIARWKRKWGAVLTPYHYFVKVNDPSLFEWSAERTLETWPGFYVVPFDRLRGG